MEERGPPWVSIFLIELLRPNHIDSIKLLVSFSQFQSISVTCFLKLLRLQSKHFDAEYQTYYWHNSTTGQSLWSDEEEADDVDLNHADSGMQLQSIQKQNGENSVVGTTQPRSMKNGHAIIKGLEANNGHISPSHIDGKLLGNHLTEKLCCTTGLENGGFNSSGSSDSLLNNCSSDSADNYDSDVVSKHTEDSRNSRTSSNTMTPSGSARKDFNLFPIWIFICAILFEGPLAIVEAVIRGAIFLVVSIILFLLGVIFGSISLLRVSYFLVRDSLLCFAAVITLCLPGAPIFVYRRYDRNGEWELTPIPTLLGWVDSRRFSSFTLGNGSFAINVRQDILADDSNHQIGDTSVYDSHRNGSICHDSWSGDIYLEPRKVLGDSLRTIREKANEEILRNRDARTKKSLNKEYSAVGTSDSDIIDSI